MDLSVQLCCHIINFLAFPLKWYTQKRRSRLLASFNENLSEQYQGQIKEIRRISDNIRRGVHYCSEAEIKGVARKVPELVSYFNDVVLSLQRDLQKREEERWGLFQQAIEEQNRRMREEPQDLFAKMSQLLTKKPENELGEPMKQMLDREAYNFAAGIREVPMKDKDHSRPIIPSGDRTTQSIQLNQASVFHSKIEIQEASMILRPFFDFDRISPPSVDENIYIEGEAVQRLQTWTAQTSSSFLGIFGPVSHSDKNTAELLVLNYIRAAKGAGIPCVSYFCTITHESPPPGRTRETVGLVALLYGLLTQLILHLPLQLPETPIIEREKVEALDGTLRTWHIALPFFRNLLTLIEPPYLLIAIHGLELLEHEATAPYLESFLDALRQSNRMDTRDGPRLKVLIATSGMSQTLGERLREEEICDISRGSAARKPGQARKGRQNMGEVDFPEE